MTELTKKYIGHTEAMHRIATMNNPSLKIHVLGFCNETVRWGKVVRVKSIRRKLKFKDNKFTVTTFHGEQAEVVPFIWEFDGEANDRGSFHSMTWERV